MRCPFLCPRTSLSPSPGESSPPLPPTRGGTERRLTRSVPNPGGLEQGIVKDLPPEEPLGRNRGQLLLKGRRPN